MENQRLQGQFEFDDFLLDVAKRRLFYRDAPVSLTPKEFDLLDFLIANSERVVSKSELLERVWPETYVEEATLTRNLSWLRKKLAAHAGSNVVFIETLPKRGYRFAAEAAEVGVGTIVVEEETVSRLVVEETIEIASSPLVGNIHRPGAIEKSPSRGRFWPLIVAPAIVALVVACFWFGFARRETAILNSTRITPFSGNPGHESSPSFSPDGKAIVYSWDGGVDDAGLDVYLKMVDSGEPLRLTKTAEDELNPVFSPDGKTIAFLRHFVDHNEIRTIPVLGGSERLIDANASFASLSYSPDGAMLAVAELSLDSDEAGIYLIDIASGARRRLTSPEAPAVDHTPRFSPDGRQVSFIRYFGSLRRELFVVSSSGGEPRQLTHDNVRIYGSAWDSDGRSLFFTSFRLNGQPNLWQIAIAGGEPRLLPTGSRDLDELAMSPDGRTIAFVDETSDENIWEIGAGRPRPVIRSTRADVSPQLSPDGTRLVFSSDRSGIFQIWVANSDGTAQRQITDGEMPAGSPRFSPDGNSIAFDVQTSDGGDVFIVSLNGGVPRRLTDGASRNYLPSWSADGKSVNFVSERSGSAQLWRIGIDGGAPKMITTGGAFESMATADGQKIVYSKAPGKAGLWMVGVDGEGGETPVKGLEQAGVWRSWFVGANGVFFVAFATQPPFSVMYFDFSTGTSRTVATADRLPLLYYSNLAGTPDGRRLFFARQDQSKSSIMLARLDR